MKKEKISYLKKKINAVILAHNYQLPEIQDIADFTGDSLGLSQEAASTDADVIIFCGVDFMAETAKILSPEKKVILPARDATCPMADMITSDELKEFKKEYPEAAVVSYVNTTADVKAESDVCCTSSNAIKIVRSVQEDTVIFTPDKNLAWYVSQNVDKKIISWAGFCSVHDNIKLEEVKKNKLKYPDAVFIAHPECRSEVLQVADYISSTSRMFDVVRKVAKRTFIIGTEEGIVYPLKKQFPDRIFIPAQTDIICPNMKKVTLDKVIDSMENLSPEIKLDDSIMSKARQSLNRMLELS